MSFLDNIGKKTKEFTDTTKLNSQVESERRAVNDVYQQIGQKYFEDSRAAPGEGYGDMFALVEASLARIEDCQEQLRRIKGIILCPNCGAENAPGAVFCPACGAKLPEPPPPEEKPPEPAAPKCLSCGAALAPGAAFCVNCGAKVAPPEQPPAENAPAAPKCPSCGDALAPGAAFCANCGAKVE